MTQSDGGLDQDEVEVEDVLWRGRPDRFLFVQRTDWLVMAIGAAWLAGWVAVLAARDLLHSSNSIYLFLRLGAVLAGTAVTLGHPLVRAFWLSKTWYTVTDRRVITETDKSEGSAPHDVLLPPVLREGADEGGSIAFGRFPTAWDTVVSVWQGKRRYGTYPSIVLHHIWPVARVHALITEARAHT